MDYLHETLKIARENAAVQFNKKLILSDKVSAVPESDLMREIDGLLSEKPFERLADS